MNIKKDECGFGFTLTLLFLGLFSILLILTGFVRFSVEARSDFRYFCYNDLRQVQEILLKNELKLLALNPTANALRIRLRLLYAELAAATATLNAPLISQATQMIVQTKNQQRALNNQQQFLIIAGNNEARIRLASAYAQLIDKNRERSLVWSEILQIRNGLRLNSYIPSMAVSPDSRIDNAPAYELNPDFENEQQITAFWTLWFLARPGLETRENSRPHIWSLRCDSRPQNRTQFKTLVKADRL